MGPRPVVDHCGNQPGAEPLPAVLVLSACSRNGGGEGGDPGHVHRCVNPISHADVVDRAVLESPAVVGDDEEERG
jgi:hypothetical protein